MNFSDIFKSSFLENVSAVSYFDMALALVLAFGLGLFIFLVYKKTYTGVMYSSSFGVTLDYNLRTGLGCTDFLNPDCITVPAGDAPIILEVKWDAFLPDIIRDAVQLQGRRVSAFSKYAQCRIYG